MNDDIYSAYMEAGALAKRFREEAAGMVVPGASVLELVDTIEQAILDEGAGIAFPLNISINEDAAHDTAGPGDERLFCEGDVVKVDLGVHIDGYVADTAQTIDLGDHALLVEASREALNAAIALVCPGVTTGELGTAIQHEIESRGFRPVANLTGHGLSQYSLHGEPMIPNVAMTGGAVIEEGMVFAVEPFASTGTGMVSDGTRTLIYSQIANRGVRLASAKRVLNQIRDRRSLPFSKRWLTGDKIDLALSTLKKNGVVRGYPVLHDIPGSYVSQAEHTLIVTEDGCVATTL
ncbi:type II methionyl aminopeptidase [Methanogenium organophilum]|uniref:Methionine aminopeptidase n=1 Tax=Methanogenium organophilum TaxID=2199 RepID=A0A9X9T7L8_METOG|nr:type II methionyl aminopeptidase [Methanogenium organophilum]WAI00237.1 type II methionyl aminopeptidase [Methanogenium organophilum]